MIYRRATLNDVQRPDFRSLVLCGVRSHDVGLSVNANKLFDFCWHLVAGPMNYLAIAEDDGVCVAYIGAVYSEHPWLDRGLMNAVGWYSLRPFAGMRLLSTLLKWSESRPNVKGVFLSFNPVMRERLCKVLRDRYAVHDVGAALIHV